MHLRRESTFPGIVQTVFEWNATERETLERAADLLGRARELVGPDEDLGMDLGKGEVVLRDWLDGAVIKMEIVPLPL